MTSTSVKLYRLRGVFFAYFAASSIFGMIVARSVLRPLTGRYSNWHVWPEGALTIFTLMVVAIIFAIAWLIFNQLLQRRNWARVLLLVIGWLTVISAVIGLLESTQLSHFLPWVSRWLPDMDWDTLIRYDRLQKTLELVFWGYLISVLQFDAKVKGEFCPHRENMIIPLQNR